MRNVQRIFVFLLVVAAAESAQKADSDFVESTLQVLSSARLHRTSGRIEIAVVVGTAGDRRKADDLALLFQTKAHDFMALGGVAAKGYQLPDNRDASSIINTKTDAVVVLQASPKNLASLQAFSTVYSVLTISRRPQDLGRVSFVILAPDIYLDGDRLNDEQVAIDDRMKNSRCKPAKSANYQSDFLSAQQDAAKQGAKPDWNNIILRLRMASLAEKKESSTPLSSIGTNNTPYAPHFYLSWALARVGDCECARAEWEQSDPEVRSAIRPKKRVDDVDTLVHVGCKRQPRNEGAIGWVIGSF